jgi:hypothetical protein
VPTTRSLACWRRSGSPRRRRGRSPISSAWRRRRAFTARSSSTRRPRAPTSWPSFFLHRDLDWQRLRRQDEDLMALEDNCCALGDEATISCDARFLDGFLGKHSEYPVTEPRQRALLRWVLGHELGHLAHHQGGLHFVPVERRRQSLRNLAVQRQEYAADCWMYQRLTDLYGAGEVVAVESLAIDLINTRLLQTRGRPPVGAGILYDYTRLDLYDFRVDASHPDLLLRSARLLHVATSRGRNPALESMVKGFMTRLVADPLWKDGDPCS